jgi:hypothetical protein
MEATTDGSPGRNARRAGLFYLLNILTGSLSLFFATRGAQGLEPRSISRRPAATSWSPQDEGLGHGWIRVV